jgi:hypothetical protein
MKKASKVTAICSMTFVLAFGQTALGQTDDGDWQRGNVVDSKGRLLTVLFPGGKSPLPTINRVGIGTTKPDAELHVEGAENDGSTAALKISSGPQSMILDGNEIDAVIAGLYLNHNTNQKVILATGGGNVGIGKADPQTKLDVAGTTRTQILEITGGADLAEPFEIADQDSIKPGMVMVIDPEHPGRLRLADRAYDRTVAGIVSGANGINPGLTMKQEEMIGNDALPVALTGRVYCWVDACNGAIRPGDLLTTSDTPGHAMKVTDYEKAQGAIIGKAMTSHPEGKGLVLVLVTLQ